MPDTFSFFSPYSMDLIIIGLLGSPSHFQTFLLSATLRYNVNNESCHRPPSTQDNPEIFYNLEVPITPTLCNTPIVSPFELLLYNSF